jgi:hypothetical protein
VNCGVGGAGNAFRGAGADFYGFFVSTDVGNDLIKALWPVVAVLIACSACRGDTTAASSASGPPSAYAPSAGAASPSPRARAAALTKAQAARRYLRIVGPYNAALNRFQTAAHANKPWIGLRPLAGRIATANTAQIRALRTTPWPANARKDIAALIAISTRAGRSWNAAAKATTPQRFQTAVLQAARLSGKREATALRQDLNLPAYRKP